MTTKIKLIEVPDEMLSILGTPDEGTRIYRAEGGQEEYDEWYSKLMELCPNGVVSPGGANMFAPVTRAAVYKRLREGNLTAFFYHIVKKYKTWLGKDVKYRETPYGFVVVDELRAWKSELMERSQNMLTQEEYEALQLERMGTKKDEKGKGVLNPQKRKGRKAGK